MTSPIAYRDKHALIIGINKYPRDPLYYCINDAVNLGTTLKRINFKVTSKTDCNLIEFYGVIDTFAERIQRDDLVIFYFAGHGKQYKKENYLLPSDYDYNHRGHEYDYITNHAVNVKYVMKKIDSRPCRIIIYLFDCCRNFIRTRTTNMDQGLSSMSTTSDGLIVYACAPGKAVEDETRNDRNGSFIENLLKYITIPNKDIQEIIQDVARDVYAQTGGFQSPQQTSSLRGKVFLVVDDHQETANRVKTDVKSKPNQTDRHFTSKNSRFSNQHPSNSHIANNDIDVQPLNHQRTESNNKNDKCLFPSIKSPIPRATGKPKASKGLDSLQQIKNSEGEKKVADSQGQRSPLVDTRDAIPETRRFDRLSSSRSKQSSDYFSKPISSSQQIYHSESCNVQENFQNNDDSSPLKYADDFETDTDSDTDTSQDRSKLFQKIRHNSESDSSLTQSVYDDFQNNSSVVLKETSTSSTQHAPVKADNEISPSLSRSNDTGSRIVQIRSLLGKHRFKTLINTTMKDLVNIIWNEVKFDMERYRKDSHVLLLFNHRLHIFIDSNINALVKDFISLSPPSHLPINDLTDFYVYGLPLEHAHSMYNFDKDCSSLFGNPNLWYPVYFTNYEQLERPQSIFLSSLYALRLYFRPENQELLAQQVAMEAQFFLQLRKYLFPPAILAFKHAVAGSMLWFEKPLLMDGLIQLLTRLCNPETVDPKEICDFIPLLLCWLLEKCDPNEEKEDHFPEVKLINAQTGKRSYFQNPVTTSEDKRKILLLEEFDERHNHDAIQHHFDIRSLIVYLTSVTNTSLSYPCDCDSYIIYDPIIQEPYFLESVEYWSESVIKELYTTMAQTQEYHSFSIVTRGLLTADVKNQLVLLQENRTVALLFSQKKVMRSDGRTREDVDHFFKIFDPLKCTKETSYIRAEVDTFFDERELEPRFPLYINDSLNITTANINSFIHNEPTSPAHQVTVILLDRSRSMSDYRITSCDKTKNLTHINICEIMVGRLSDNVLATNEIHALGRIEFATKYKTVCPITRSREEFEKALNYYNGNKEWTCMNDAIGEAIRQIKTFTDSPRRARRDCKKLIICLSDGINNYDDTTTKNLHDLVRKNKIVIDFISFIRDDELKTEKEVLQTRPMRKLCTDSGGYVYRNIQLLSDIELAAIFEQEAAVWLSKRSRTSHGAVDKPVRYVPSIFKEVAVHRLPSTNNVQSSSQSRRIFNEFHAQVSDPLDNVTIFAVPSNIAFWKVILKGPAKTPYEGKFWILFVEFDSNYPKCSPNVRFVTPIYHVNISGDGKICHQIFDRGWSQQTKMRTVFKNILDLFEEPNFIDAVSLEMAHLYNTNNNEYKKQAEIHSKKYAKNDIATLKREYRLEDDGYQ